MTNCGRSMVGREDCQTPELTKNNRWVKTAMGQAIADTVGLSEPPLDVHESAKGVIQQV